MGFNPLLFSGFTTGGSGGGGGSSPTIGGPVTGGTLGSVLFINPNGTLSQDNVNFNYSTATTFLTVGGLILPGGNVQTQLNGKQGTLTFGSISTSTSGVTITNGSNSTVGPNVTVNIQNASTSQNGLLTSADWNTFNGKQASGSYVLTSSVGIANGVASLDTGGKVPASQLPSTLLNFRGAWNASTNIPTLVDGTGTLGDVYRTSVSGTQTFGGVSALYNVGDLIIYNGTIWQHSPAADGVSSVNGFTGAVTLTQGNFTEATSSVLTISGGTNAVWGSGLSVQVKQASNSVSGYLSSTDWNIFNNKQASGLALLLTGGSPTGPITSSSTITATNISGSTSGTNTGDQTITLTGDVSGSGTSGITTGILATTVTGKLLTGFISGPSTAVLATDTILQGLQKLQAQVSTSPVVSPGDINETSFSAANNQSSPVNVTSFVFANATVRSFRALVSVFINATSSLYEVFDIIGVQKGASWNLSVVSNGDNSGIVFSITNAGQIQYTSTNITGFTSDTMKFRAITTSV